MSEELTWTHDKPTLPGWYWFKMRDTRPCVVEVVKEQDSHRLAIIQTGGCVDDLEAENYQWAGPMEPPQ